MKKLVSLFLIILVSSCGGSDDPKEKILGVDFRAEMRSFVTNISVYGKAENPNFIVIPQNGQELVTENGEEDGNPVATYLAAIDGVGREDLFYGYNSDNQATPSSESTYMIAFLDVCESNGVQVLTTDYCSTESKMADSYSENSSKGYISFAAPSRELELIPNYPAKPFNENSADITSLSEAKNFLYLLNPDNFGSTTQMVTDLSNTNYDVIIMDYFFDEKEFSTAEIAQLKIKKNGGSRLVISYMSIGEAEDYRYYWQTSWSSNKPDWLSKENSNWPGNFKVKYWEDEWQAIILGSDDAYLDKILSKGFDGVYLDIIDAFEFFE